MLSDVRIILLEVTSFIAVMFLVKESTLFIDVSFLPSIYMIDYAT